MKLTRFVITQGEHTASPSMFGIHAGMKGFKARFRFNSSCLYPQLLGKPWNKLCGISFNTLPWYDEEKNKREKMLTTYKGTIVDKIKAYFKSFSPGHHKNSLRLGWRANGENIELSLYMYVNKVRITEKIAEFSNVKEVEIVISVVDNGIMWSFDRGINKHVKKLPAPIKIGWGYYLKPYFGGKEPAPNGMVIDLGFKPY